MMEIMFRLKHISNELRMEKSIYDNIPIRFLPFSMIIPKFKDSINDLDKWETKQQRYTVMASIDDAICEVY